MVAVVAEEFGSWRVEMVVELVVAAEAWVVYLVVEVLGHSLCRAIRARRWVPWVRGAMGPGRMVDLRETYRLIQT